MRHDNYLKTLEKFESDASATLDSVGEILREEKAIYAEQADASENYMADGGHRFMEGVKGMMVVSFMLEGVASADDKDDYVKYLKDFHTFTRNDDSAPFEARDVENAVINLIGRSY